MSVTRLIDVNATGGVYIDVLSSIPARRVEIVEDDSVTAQGLDYKIRDDGTAAGFTTVLDLVAGKEPIVLGNVVAHGNNQGPIIGFPAQNAPATAWLIGDAKVKGDQVTDDGKAYTCIADSTGEKPVLFKNKWAIIPTYVAATKLISLKSKNLATKVRVTEYE